jgi:hypothetical protein
MARLHPRRAVIVLTSVLALAGCSSEPVPQASYSPLRVGFPKEEKLTRGKSDSFDFLQRLNYDKPIFGIRLPLEEEESGGPKAEHPGVVEIEEARIEPSGRGPWKSSWNPVLRLRGVRIEGSDPQIQKFIWRLSRAQPGGVEIQNLEIKDLRVPGVIWTASRATASHGGLLLEGGFRSQGPVSQPVNFFSCRASEKASSSYTN